MRTFYLLLVMMIGGIQLLNGQNNERHVQAEKDCGCEPASKVRVCYLSISEYCVGTDFNCNYTFDGSFFSNGLVKKLLNTNNFGVNGKAGCAMEIHKLTNITSATTIRDQECDIVFIGNFPMDSITKKTNLDKTTISQPKLNAIKEWSQECEKNLVILTQAEAQTWGYVVKDENTNPNTPDPSELKFDAFDGPFGKLTSFNQGGGYQGVFTTLPSTGVKILARDRNNKPTIALDNATNDIILGDIGILCSGSAGPISTGTNVNNSNDILACNLFAIGCRIAGGASYNEMTIEICPDESILIPNGYMVNKEGLYVDSLLTIEKCDSIIQTRVKFYKTPTTSESHDGCIGDGYVIEINNTKYNELKPSGQEILQSMHGCDSIVMIDLKYKLNAFDTINLESCHASGFIYTVDQQKFDELFPQGFEKIKASNGCDSTVMVDLTFNPLDTVQLMFNVCPDEILNFDGYELKEESTNYIAYKNQKNCDSTVIVDVFLFENDTNFVFQRDLVIGNENPYTLKNTGPSFSKIKWTPFTGLSCDDCLNPTIEAFNTITNYKISIWDEHGCLREESLDISYRCSPAIPNIFRPGSTGGNDKLKMVMTCDFENFNLKIYDRWGNLMFSSNNIESAWDGTRNGSAAIAGVYVYYLTYSQNGLNYTENGDVTLIR